MKYFMTIFFYTEHVHMLVYERYHLSIVYPKKSKGIPCREAK